MLRNIRIQAARLSRDRPSCATLRCMTERYISLDPSARAAVEELVFKCERFDDASACVQIDHGLNADKTAHSWFLRVEDGALVGLCSVFAPRPEEAELSFCVRPGARGRGVGSGLAEEAARYWAQRGAEKLLLVCDRASESGAAFVHTRAESIDHSEYSLRLHRHAFTAASTGSPPRRLEIRRVVRADLEAVSLVCADAFEDDPEKARAFIENSFATERRELYAGEVDSRIVCVCAIAHEDRDVSINSVAVRTSYQGRGYATEFLSRIIRERVSAGMEISIEVDSNNRKAHRLYLKLGFRETKTVDYHRMRKPS